MIARGARVLRRNLVRLDVPQELARTRVAFLVGVSRVDQSGVGEPIERRRREPELRSAVAIGAEDRLGAVPSGQEARDHVALGAHVASAGGTERSDPDRWMGLLVRPRPDVDLAMMEVFALPVEGAVVTCPRLEDEIVRLPEALH